MAKTREIKGRIKAVSNIQRITKTMQMIATARFQAASKRVTAARPYTQKIIQLVGELASAQAGQTITHPLLRTADPEKPGKALLLVISSNRGLAGAYNANVLREAVGFLRSQGEREIVLEVVGKKAMALFKFSRRKVSQFHSQMPETPSYAEVEKLAQRYMDEFVRGDYDSVYICYMSFQSMGKQSARVLPLLPLQNPTADVVATTTTRPVQYDYSPEPAELLGQLLPLTVKTQLYQCFNEAALGEQIFRMVAMKSATDAAGKMRKSLIRQYNRARQAAITTELTEIIAGASGLS